MPTFIRFTTSVVLLLPLLADSIASGEESISGESRRLAFAEPWESDSQGIQEVAIEPTIDITGNGFVSKLPRTPWRFGTELLVYHTDYGSVDFHSRDGDSELASGLRVLLGLESDSGFGFRARFSGVSGEGSSDMFSLHRAPSSNGSTLRGFDFRGAAPTAVGSTSLDVVAGTFNLELYKRIERNRFSLVAGSGLSSAVIRLDVPTVHLENSIVAGGGSLFSEGRYVMYHSEVSELALVGGGRVAFLAGEWEGLDSSGFVRIDSDLTVTEGALGLEWKRDLQRAVLVLRAQYENQVWDSDVTSDLVFNGGVIRAGLSW